MSALNYRDWESWPDDWLDRLRDRLARTAPPRTGPCCCNAACGALLRRRQGENSYEGGRGLCAPCYRRAHAAGFPDVVPDPRPVSDRWEAAREAQSAARAERLEDYGIYRRRGLTVLQAAERLGVAPTTAYGYEGALRKTRQKVRAA